jgi:primosomal protein N' (replication factor Y) (superfamily II helicase)
LNPAEVRVEVALPLPIHRTFTYRVDTLQAPPAGTRVLVPFRKEERIGWVVGPGAGAEIERVRPVLAVLEDEPSVPAELLELCRWMADYYVTPLGIALRTALPSVLSDVSRDYLTLVNEPNEDLSREGGQGCRGSEGEGRTPTSEDPPQAIGIGIDLASGALA